MESILYIKYGELTLKGKNRMTFVRVLYKNIKQALHDFEGLNIEYFYDNMKISNLSNNDVEKIIEILRFVPGIHSINVAHLVSDDINDVRACTLAVAQQEVATHGYKTFKVESRRQNKNYFLDSMKIKNIVAGNILENTELKVDLHHPELTVNVEIKNDHKAVIFGRRIMGLSGLPVGVNGRVLVLLSGGLDSPVAAKLLMNRGLAVDFITFITPPHTSERALQKVRDLAKVISMDNRLCNSKLYVCDFSSMQHELTHIAKESYRITLMRRYFFRIAKRIALEHKLSAIATGESIGQVASQTLESMQVITKVLDDFLVLKPLLTYEKEDIITKAKFFGTHDLSILPYNDSCSVFAPKNPTTQPKLEVAEKLEQSLDLIDSIMENVLEKHTWLETYNGNEFTKRN
ncbi:tRNA uracil 4-sulfurtransferase ThiI [Ureaplasma ceti]|uniref:Probable tRNA sulfurtransferase n=1 Tax=Ureaplasma ceti TaxID=3119530 RepID=A0ABP9U5F8_9BACT